MEFKSFRQYLKFYFWGWVIKVSCKDFEQPERCTVPHPHFTAYLNTTPPWLRFASPFPKFVNPTAYIHWALSVTSRTLVIPYANIRSQLKPAYIWPIKTWESEISTLGLFKPKTLFQGSVPRIKLKNVTRLRLFLLGLFLRQLLYPKALQVGIFDINDIKMSDARMWSESWPSVSE